MRSNWLDLDQSVIAHAERPDRSRLPAAASLLIVGLLSAALWIGIARLVRLVL